MSSTTLIRNISWLVAWDEVNQKHTYIKNGDLVMNGDTILYVGESYTGSADYTVDGSNTMVIPGLLSLHTHPWAQLPGKGFYEDMSMMGRLVAGSPEYIFPLDGDVETMLAATRVGIAELLKTGCTTFADLSTPFPRGNHRDWGDEWLDILANSGIRAYACPMAREAYWSTSNGQDMKWVWDIEAGRKEFERGLEIIDRAERHSSSLLRGMVGIAQVDTAGKDLFRDSYQAALDREIPFQTHASQALFEVEEMRKRYDMTPIEWLDSVGALGPNTLLGHAVYTELHPSTPDCVRRDLELIQERGASVVHCPRSFAEMGDALHSFGKYQNRGVNIALGTDTMQLNMIEEMRLALYLSRVLDSTDDSPSTLDVFNSATINGAKALLRNDLGRLCGGCRADFSIVDLTTAEMRPARDPLRNFVFSANSQSVRDVYVAGTKVVSDRSIVCFDEEEAIQKLEAGQERAAKNVPKVHYAGIDADSMAPLSLSVANTQ
ncbi:MAG: amidohydrolase family protein [Pseudomonadales bacterium]